MPWWRKYRIAAAVSRAIRDRAAGEIERAILAIEHSFHLMRRLRVGRIFEADETAVIISIFGSRCIFLASWLINFGSTNGSSPWMLMMCETSRIFAAISAMRSVPLA